MLLCDGLRSYGQPALVMDLLRSEFHFCSSQFSQHGQAVLNTHAFHLPVLHLLTELHKGAPCRVDRVYIVIGRPLGSNRYASVGVVRHCFSLLSDNETRRSEINSGSLYLTMQRELGLFERRQEMAAGKQ